MNKVLLNTISTFSKSLISEDRKSLLDELAIYLVEKLKERGEAKLNFICTHNSRRSQLSQVWGQALADYFKLPIKCYSGGVEVTAFNPRAVATLLEDGFEVMVKGLENPHYSFVFGENQLITFSKLYNDPVNPESDFAAIMTCDHADENCPFIPGAAIRIPVRFEDPKAFDNTPLESQKYLERSRQIGAELFYVFSSVAKNFH
ncbi:low molecular weight phosphatase family protein [Algoriphagus marinus]|uniref:protein-tyrosine-phosphatase n=1 Tax=Algoriphagus marinus TaxID=1925762 RepID=UPI00094BBBC4|nr:protein-tyrosine-phosphatase [Algoriphagus marinus]